MKDDPPPDAFAARARPAFLYLIYALLLWSIPMGLIAGARPELAAAITAGMRAYLNALPEPLYALFGTAYLGYTAARAWGKRRAWRNRRKNERGRRTRAMKPAPTARH